MLDTRAVACNCLVPLCVEDALIDCGFDVPASLKRLAAMECMVLLHNEVPKLVPVGSTVFDLAFVLLNVSFDSDLKKQRSFKLVSGELVRLQHKFDERHLFPH